MMKGILEKVQHVPIGVLKKIDFIHKRIIQMMLNIDVSLNILYIN
jgi:hypothetical protein